MAGAVAAGVLMAVPMGAAADWGVEILTSGGPYDTYTAAYAIEEGSGVINMCAGDIRCNLNLFATSDMWANDFYPSYSTSNENDVWRPCLTDPAMKTLGDVARCNREKGVPNRLVARDFLPQEVSVKDHSNACMKWADGKNLGNRNFPSVSCKPIGGVLGSCKFDTSSVGLSFTATSGDLKNTPTSSASVRVSCSQPARITVSLDASSYPVALSGPGKPGNQATIDIGAGVGKPKVLTLSGGGMAETLNVSGWVSGSYEPGTVRGSTSLILSLY